MERVTLTRQQDQWLWTLPADEQQHMKDLLATGGCVLATYDGGCTFVVVLAESEDDPREGLPRGVGARSAGSPPVVSITHITYLFSFHQSTWTPCVLMRACPAILTRKEVPAMMTFIAIMVITGPLVTAAWWVAEIIRHFGRQRPTTHPARGGVKAYRPLLPVSAKAGHCT